MNKKSLALLAVGRVTTSPAAQQAMAASREAERLDRCIKLANLFLIKKGVSVEVDEQAAGVFLHLTTFHSAAKVFQLFVREKAALQAHGENRFTVFVPGFCALLMAWEPSLLLDKQQREEAAQRGLALPAQAPTPAKTLFTSAVKPVASC